MDEDGTPGVDGWLDRMVAGRIGMAGADSGRRPPGGGGAGMAAVFFAAVGRTKGVAAITAAGLGTAGGTGWADSVFSSILVSTMVGAAGVSGVSATAGFSSGFFSRKDSSISFATMGAAIIGAATSAFFSAMGVGFAGSTTGSEAAGTGGGVAGAGA